MPIQLLGQNYLTQAFLTMNQYLSTDSPIPGTQPDTLADSDSNIDFTSSIVTPEQLQKLDQPNTRFNPPLTIHHEVAMGDFKSVERLLKQGVNPNHIPKSGYSPLWKAVDANNYKLAKLLIEHGADVNYQHNGTPILHSIIKRHDCEEMIQLLVESGADINAVTMDESALSLAISSGELKKVDLLLNLGADPNIQLFIPGFGESTPLLEVVSAYYQFSLDHPEIKTRHALYYKENYFAMISSLVKAGANINQIEPQLPLFLAITLDTDPDFITHLVDCGADPLAGKSFNETPMTAVQLLATDERILKKFRLATKQHFYTGEFAGFAERGSVFLSSFAISLMVFHTLANYWIPQKTKSSIAARNVEVREPGMKHPLKSERQPSNTTNKPNNTLPSSPSLTDRYLLGPIAFVVNLILAPFRYLLRFVL